MVYVCKYCDNSFSRNAILRKHQATAKYCLIKQGKLEQEQTNYTYTCTCKYCKKEFRRKDVVKRHEQNCPCRAQSQDKQLLEMIVQLQQTIVGMAERPVGTTNVNTNNNTNRNMTMNLAPITDEEIQEHLEHLTLDFINAGAKGYASFANCYPFKDRVLCTDKARKKLRYRDNEGEVEDSCGLKLARRFFQAIAPRNEEIINAEYRSLCVEVQQIANNGTAYCSDLTGLLTKASHLQDLLIKCRQAAKGEENDLTKEFISHLSKML